MKILYYNINSGSFMSQWQGIHIFDELEHYDIHFEEFNPWEYSSYEEANNALIKKLKDEKGIDLFMNCLSSEMLLPETMKEIAKIPIPKLCICYDNLHAPYMHKEIAHYFDLVWLTSWETENMFKKWGCKTLFQPYAANPYAFKDAFNEQVNKVCFIGTPYGTRTMMFNNLTQSGIDVDVFCKPNPTMTRQPGEDKVKVKEIKVHSHIGEVIKSTQEMLSFPIGRKVLYSRIKKAINGTPGLIESEHLNQLEKLSFEDMNKAYSDYALSLNIIALRNTAVLKHPLQKLHLRTFEIPMSCGLELVEYNEELASYFTEEEMVFYRDKEEMIDKARFYTDPKNANLCRAMKLKAREKALREHSWMSRFSKVFKELGLKYNEKPDVQAI